MLITQARKASREKSILGSKSRGEVLMIAQSRTAAPGNRKEVVLACYCACDLCCARAQRQRAFRPTVNVPHTIRGSCAASCTRHPVAACHETLGATKSGRYSLAEQMSQPWYSSTTAIRPCPPSTSAMGFSAKLKIKPGHTGHSPLHG